MKKNILVTIIRVSRIQAKKFYKKLTLFKEKKFLNFIYKKYISNNPRVEKILNTKIKNSHMDLSAERNLPNKILFKENDWWKTMLIRYGIASHFSHGNDVIETCSGLGWGAYILDEFAKSVTCIEIDKESINLSKEYWKTKNTRYLNNSIFELPFPDQSFDVATAMESIEHLHKNDIIRYLKEIHRVLKKNSLIIGSSAFPGTREAALKLCSNNPNHLYICTENEIREILTQSGFRKIKIFQNKLFFTAIK